ncbi:MAG: glutathione S-transferase family protein [Steroidobacterales bacterium]
MAQFTLVIGNKNYSSWSMRPWVLLRQAGIAFKEVQLKFDDAARAEGVEIYSPTGLVPVLMTDGQPVWDTLAICETVAEMFPQQGLWPADARARQVARSICAEMHAGFRDLRGAMPMNIRSAHAGKGMNPAVRKDIERIVSIWQSCRERCGRGGEMLFGSFGVADAFYAPVVMRFMTYAVELPPVAQAYANAVRTLPAVLDWVAAARQETGFVAADEPYATK